MRYRRTYVRCIFPKLRFFFFRMNEVKKFVSDVREEERRKEEERVMNEKRGAASLKIQVFINTYQSIIDVKF